MQLDQMIDLDGTTVVVGGTLGGTGSFSGAGVQTPFWHVLELRDGRLARMRLFFDRGQAFEAAGAVGDDGLLDPRR
jgi:ketosteroid isomerase-like protein